MLYEWYSIYNSSNVVYNCSISTASVHRLYRRLLLSVQYMLALFLNVA
jgi:hypothetical protein